MDYHKLKWIKKQVVIALFSDDELMERFVVKGGSALELGYLYATGRSSIDVDISMADDFEPQDVSVVGDRIIKRVTDHFREHGYEVFDASFGPRPKTRRPELPFFWGGYLLEFKLISSERYKAHKSDYNTLRRLAEIVGTKQRKKFKVDISKHEYCTHKKATDIEDYHIYMYTPQLLIVEKLRAICQQMPEYPYGRRTKSPRARDFYDIYVISENETDLKWDSPDFLETVRKTFSAKGVDLILLSQVGNQEIKEFHERDFISVQDTVPPNVSLREFDFYFDYVVQRIVNLKSLWEE